MPNLTATKSGRRALFTACYFVEGAPIGFLWWCLPTLMRSRGVEPREIGALLAWLVLPWAFKWVWAPAIDAFEWRRFGLRGWIAAAQVGMVVTLLPLVRADDFITSAWLAPCLIGHAAFAATQDVGIDALMVRSTPGSERARISAWMQVGMLSARGAFGGGALLLVGRHGERAVILALLSVVLLGLVLHTTYRTPPRAVRERRVGRLLVDAARRRSTWAMLAFGAVGGAGFEAVGAFAGPLLTERAGGDTTLSGHFFLWPAIVASAVGGLAGGAWTDRLGVRRGTLIAGASIAVTVIALATVVALDAEATDALVPWLVTVYVSIGWFTASSYALFMRWTDPRLGATQFSAYMGTTNLCESWSVAVAGACVVPYGYGPTFGALALVGFASLAFVRLAEERTEGSSPPDARPTSPSI